MQRRAVNAVKPVPYVPFCDLKIPMEIGYGTLNPEIQHIREMDQSGKCRRSEWIKYEVVLTAQDDVRGAQFAITFDVPGIAEFDLISMIPEDAVAGIFRKDLFEALQAIKPGFVRFPGGCIVEGISLDNRYYWKNTVGDVKDRRYIPNLWAFDDDWSKNDPMTKRPDAHYGQSFGLGFYEYFLLCELLDAKPLPVLNIGTACQFRSTEMVDSDNPKFEEYVQDALDLIEFANGPVDSTWGALRARMGHPESFHMDFLSVGNEQWETQYLDMKHRYERFAQAIHAKYPGDPAAWNRRSFYGIAPSQRMHGSSIGKRRKRIRTSAMLWMSIIMSVHSGYMTMWQCMMSIRGMWQYLPESTPHIPKTGQTPWRVRWRKQHF